MPCSHHTLPIGCLPLTITQSNPSTLQQGFMTAELTVSFSSMALILQLLKAAPMPLTVPCQDGSPFPQFQLSPRPLAAW